MITWPGHLGCGSGYPDTTCRSDLAFTWLGPFDNKVVIPFLDEHTIHGLIGGRNTVGHLAEVTDRGFNRAGQHPQGEITSASQAPRWRCSRAGSHQMFKVTIRSLGWMASQTPKPTMWPLVNFTGRSAAPIRSRITLSDRDWSAASAQVSAVTCGNQAWPLSGRGRAYTVVLPGWRCGERAGDGGRSAGHQARGRRTGQHVGPARGVCGTAHVTWIGSWQTGHVGGRGATIGTMGPVTGAGAAAGGAAGAGAGGVVYPSPAVRAAAGGGPGERGVGAAGQRQRRCCCGPGSAGRAWPSARRGCRPGAASGIRSGSVCRCFRRCTRPRWGRRRCGR